MDEKEKIRNFVFAITSQEFPSQLSAYDAVSEAIFDSLFDKEESLKDITVDDNAYNEFFTEAGAVISSLSVLAGTVKTFFEIRKLIRENKKGKIEGLKKQWKDDLVKNGISEDEAEKLSKKYNEEFDRIIG